MDIEFVSLLALIHAPEIYHGQAVRVIGLCTFVADTPVMWAAQEYYTHAVTKNAVFMDLPPHTEADVAAFQGEVLLVEGVFSAENMGPKNGYSGTIEQVSRIEPWVLKAT